jgi:hypothetical protein
MDEARADITERSILRADGELAEMSRHQMQVSATLFGESLESNRRTQATLFVAFDSQE